MKTKQKIGIALGLFLVASVALLLVPAKKALAYVPSTPNEILQASFEFQDRGTIVGHFIDNNNNTHDVDFVDKNPKDETFNFKSTESDWCKQGTSGGLNFGTHGASSISWKNPRPLVQKDVFAEIDIDYSPGGTGTGCEPMKPKNPLQYINKFEFLYKYYQWNGSNLIPAMDLPSNNSTFTPNSVNDNILQSDSGCASYIKLNGDKSGTLFETSKNKYDNNVNERPDANKYLPSIFKKTGECYIKAINFSDNLGAFGIEVGRHFDLAGERGSQSSGGGGGTADNSSPACDTNFNSPFSYLLCPALRVADWAAGGFNKFVESQLKFCTGQSSTTGETCANNNLNDQVKVAWGIIKNIASALLVIILLVMVISQAIGGGPFDAYTVRKVLPKVVAAVILIQLSWVLFKWMIDISNDLGIGLKNLLFAPFGGDDNMHLDKLVGNGVQIATGGSKVGADAFAFFSVLAGGIGLLANIPGLLILALFVVTSLFTAFLVLILRKILILMLIILAPIALIAWILPGTENYWKAWKDNFIKILLMYPLIIAVIAAGRIFAWITAGGGTSTGQSFAPNIAVAHLGSLPIPYVASVTGFADLAIIIIAFFGPYLLLPKTFSWGGSIMSATARTAYGMSEKFRARAQEPVKGIGERWQGRRAKKYDPTAKWYNFNKRGLRRIQSGHYLPTKRSQLLAIATGDKWAEERNQEMVALAARKREKATAAGRNIMAGKQQAVDTLESSLKPRRTKFPGLGGKVPGLKKTDLHQRQAENAIKDLINTSSWFELENLRVKIPDESAPGGMRDGKVWETEEWRNALAGNPEFYSKVSQNRPDWAPHRLRTGLPKYRGESDESKIEANVRREGAVVGASEEDMQAEIQRRTTDTQRYKRLAAGDTVAQDALGFTEVVGEMDTRQLQSLHPMFFKRIAETAAQATKYEELARTATTDEERELNLEKAELMRKPAQELVTFLEKTAEKGGSFQIANLMGGGEMREYVDTAISASLPSVKLRPGQPPFSKDSAPYKLEDILDLRNPGAQRGASTPGEDRTVRQQRQTFQRDPRTGGTIISMPIRNQPPGSTGSSYTSQPENTDTEGGLDIR